MLLAAPVTEIAKYFEAVQTHPLFVFASWLSLGVR